MKKIKTYLETNKKAALCILCGLIAVLAAIIAATVYHGNIAKEEEETTLTTVTATAVQTTETKTEEETQSTTETVTAAPTTKVTTTKAATTAPPQTQPVAEPVTAAPAVELAHIVIPTYNQATTGYTLGCEGVSLYMALRGLGYAQSYTLDSFMATMPTGETPFEGYMGNPKIGHTGENEGKRTTIYPAPLAQWARQFASASDLTGASVETLKSELSAGHVVLAFVTSGWKAPRWKVYPWSTSAQGEVENNHCLCVVGYRDNGDILVNDCHDGRKDGRQGEYWVSGDQFASIYNARKYAVSVY